MATHVPEFRLTGEPRFFFRMALALTAIVLLGFGLQAGLGRVSYPAMPWTLHLHGILFIAWCALAMWQPLLIAGGNRRLHRRLGWVAGALALTMAFSGLWVTVTAISQGRMAPYNIFLMLNILTVAAFLALVIAGITVRRTTDWHRRLLTCATILMTGPAWARILPMPWLGSYGLIVLTVVVLSFVGWGMIHDLRARDRIHPAWYWGGIAVAVPGLLTPPLAFIPSFSDWVAGFTPA